MFDIVLWIAQGLLALLFVATGVPKIFGLGLDRWTGFADLPRGLVVVIGVAEVLGGAGLVLPMVSGVWPWLTPLAALGCATVVLMATGFHVRGDERLTALETALWSSVLVLIAVGRWDLVSSATEVASWALVAALAVLLPASLVNLVVVYRRAPATAG